MARISRRWVRSLERTADTETMTLVCPECGEEFTLHGDAAMDYIVHRWKQGYEGETYGPPTDPAIVELAAHEHDPSAFLERTSGLPFLSRSVSGINLGGVIDGGKDGV